MRPLRRRFDKHFDAIGIGASRETCLDLGYQSLGRTAWNVAGVTLAPCAFAVLRRVEERLQSVATLALHRHTFGEFTIGFSELRDVFPGKIAADEIGDDAERNQDSRD